MSSRAEVGKIADDVRPLRSCSTCNGARAIKCEAHVTGDGCEEMMISCPDCNRQSDGSDGT